MTELNARIKPLKSSTSGEVPLPSLMEVAEIAINTADGKIFTKHVDGSIKEISGAGGGGAVSSVNSQIGNVSLGIQDMDDFQPDLIGAPFYRYTQGSYDVAGEYQPNADSLLVNKIDADGEQAIAPTPNGSIWVSADGVSFQEQSITSVPDLGDSWSIGDGNSPGGAYEALGIGVGESFFWANADPSLEPAPLVDGDILQWNDTDQKFKPVRFSRIVGGTFGSGL